MANGVQLRFQELQIPMRSGFKHASAERKVSDSVWCEATRGKIRGFGEGCPRPYVTGEDTPGAIAWLEFIRSTLEAEVSSIGYLKKWIEEHRSEIDKHPAAWCAVELALIDLFARESKSTVEGLLGLQNSGGTFGYTGILSDDSEEKFVGTLKKYLTIGFRDFKFKLNGSLPVDQKKLSAFRELSRALAPGENCRIRADGNNLWKDNPTRAEPYLRALDHALFALEEPIGARQFSELGQLSANIGVPIILDESCCTMKDVLTASQETRGHWIANVRVSKMGGLIRSLEVVEECQRLNIGVIVGAQVGETSVLSRAALPVARAAGAALLAQEGCYGLLLLEYDVVEPALMFGVGGRLDYPVPGCDAIGWGLRPIGAPSPMEVRP